MKDFKKKVLLVNITRLGDMLQSTPTISGIKMENPNAHITVVIDKQFADVCSYIPDIDCVKVIDLTYMVNCLTRSGRGIVEAYHYLSKFVEELKCEEFDFCLNMSNSAYTALLLKMLNIPRVGGWISDEEGYRKIESAWSRLFASNVFYHNRAYNSLNLVDIFRCSAQVVDHPLKLQFKVPNEASKFAEELILSHQFKNKGPLIGIQAGASQDKRQWEPRYFAQLIRKLETDLDARIVLTGTKGELKIIDKILAEYTSENIIVALGKTSIPQLAALLSKLNVLITGDTGTMHLAACVNTPIVSMFLASAFAFETGPYGADHIIVQPQISCNPCNPSKVCLKTDCHDQITPELIVELTRRSISRDFSPLNSALINSAEVIAYKTCFDEFGFYNLEPLHPVPSSPELILRECYRKMWLKLLGGHRVSEKFPHYVKQARSLQVREKLSQFQSELEALQNKAELGVFYIKELINAISDSSIAPSRFAELGASISDLDREVEEFGLVNPALCPITKMFVFDKENLIGTDAHELASQMKEVYSSLQIRAKTLCNILNSFRSHKPTQALNSQEEFGTERFSDARALL
jgi:ADP-heptose:LPS heptosyltransferase